MGASVVVLGGGIAGMSAAQELGERGFDVTVYEKKRITGGKARTIFVPGTGEDGRKDLPGEHGFRFFPSFYCHLPDTMKRIPFEGNERGVYDNLISTHRTLIARQDPPEEIPVIAHFPRNLDDVRAAWNLFRSDFGIPFKDFAFFYYRTLTLLTSADERRLGEFDSIPWWEFIEADRRSDEFSKYFGDVAVRFLVAMAPRRASTRTVGNIGLQLSLGHLDPTMDVDRLLNGPTHDVWIDPWYAHLESLGVKIHTEHTGVALNMSGGKIESIAVVGPNGEQINATADHYVVAVPYERMIELLSPELIAADPSLADIKRLTSDWMNGVQFFLSRDIPLASGHIVFANAPWAVTAISQAQFWNQTDLSKYGNGKVRGVLSCVISNWQAKGDYSKKAAMFCTREEIKHEIWSEVKAHLNDMGETIIRDEDLVDWYLADSIRHLDDGTVVNDEPLLINTVNTWASRPSAVTKIPNLFLAADYVKTNTDLATMEAANEAARRATNGIIDRSGMRVESCRIWPLREPAVFKPFKRLDRWRFNRGLPHLLYRPDTRPPRRP